MNHEGREGREGVVLGPGYFESIYKKAMHVELTVRHGEITLQTDGQQVVVTTFTGEGK